ncbi:6324_t:CDS:2, partial [Acaulospora morrowiae]
RKSDALPPQDLRGPTPRRQVDDSAANQFFCSDHRSRRQCENGARSSTPIGLSRLEI